jgi:Cu2+-exporting ATPase
MTDPHQHHHHHEQHPHEHHQVERATSEHRQKHVAHGHAGHDHTAMIADFNRRFWISLMLTVPVMLLSPMIHEWLGFDLTFQGDKYLLFGLSSLVFWYGGWPFLKGIISELLRKAPGMMTLIALAVTVAYAYSVAVTFGLEGMEFYWELATLIDIMLLGHWLEMKSVKGASRALEMLVKMMPSQAHLARGDQVIEVKLSEINTGDTVLIKPGEKVPADGVIVGGSSHLDESMLTGESIPVEKNKGDKVIGGSVNTDGAVRVQVEHTGNDSYLSKVIKLVEAAQATKSKTQRLADRAAQLLTLIALTAGFGTLAVWLALGKEFVFALERMVTVMVISCPHALGIAVPLVVAISTALSAQRGLLIRNRTAFESSRRITTIVFDKTGTLTKGSHEVVRIEPVDSSYNEKELLRLVAGVEQNSEHFISQGVIRKAKAEGIAIPESAGFSYSPGIGVKATVDGKTIQAGGPALLDREGISLPKDGRSSAETLIYVIEGNKLIGTIAFADQIRESSAEAVKTLQRAGIKCTLLTGDNEAVAKSVADELGMDGYMSKVLPDQKLDRIKELQEAGEFVAMTGDGVNDAPALAQADVGIAVGSGTDVAAETADIILVNSDPKDIAALILFGKATYRKMMQNLLWATGYNAVAIPLAAGVLSSSGFVLSPAIGAVFMSLSTIIVAINAQLLRRIRA